MNFPSQRRARPPQRRTAWHIAMRWRRPLPVHVPSVDGWTWLLVVVCIYLGVCVLSDHNAHRSNYHAAVEAVINGTTNVTNANATVQWNVMAALMGPLEDREQLHDAFIAAHCMNHSSDRILCLSVRLMIEVSPVGIFSDIVLPSRRLRAASCVDALTCMRAVLEPHLYRIKSCITTMVEIFSATLALAHDLTTACYYAENGK